jgi:hypothetical protein
MPGKDPISDRIRADNRWPVALRLASASYVSPQSIPFCCENCDFFEEKHGYCQKLNATVEPGGICRFVSIRGVHS